MIISSVTDFVLGSYHCNTDLLVEVESLFSSSSQIPGPILYQGFVGGLVGVGMVGGVVNSFCWRIVLLLLD